MATKKTKVEVYGETSKYERSMRTVQRTSKSTSQSISSHWSKTFGTLTKLSAAFGIAGAAGFVLAGKKVITAAMEQEKAQIALGAALRANEEYTDTLMNQYTDFASSIQKVTTYGDEQILKLMALQKNLGVTSDRLEHATRASIGLAAATGRDVESMAMYIALAEQGEFTMLRRYIPALRSTTDKTEQLRIITEFAARGFLVAQENAQTFSGGLEQLKNLYGDVFERIGDVVVKNKALLELMETGKETLLEWANYIERWVDANDELIAQKTYGAIDKIKSSVEGIVEVYKKLPEGVVGAAGIGIIGRMLLGGAGGAALAAAYLAVIQFDKLAYKLPKGDTERLQRQTKDLQELQKQRWELLDQIDERMAVGLVADIAYVEGQLKPQLQSINTEIQRVIDNIHYLEGKQPSEQLKLTISGPGHIPGPAPMEEPSLAPLESYDKITEALLGAGALRGEQMLELDMVQAEILAEQMMANDTAKLEEKSQLETYMAGLLYNDLESMRWDHARRMVAIEEMEKKMKVMAAQNWLQTTMNVGNAVMAFSGKQSKTIFAIAKAAEVAKATIAAFTASNMAMATPPGPPYTLPLAASVLAMGLSNAATIAATAIGTMKGGGTAGGAVGTYPASPATGLPDIPTGVKEIKGSLTIHIHGDMIGDEGYVEMLAEKLSEAVKDRNVILYASDARFADEVV